MPDGDSSQLRRDYAVLGPSLELEERDPLTIPGTPGDDRDANERVSYQEFFLSSKRAGRRGTWRETCKSW